MTLTGEYSPNSLPGQEQPIYPTIFGITFTPTVSGILIGVFGLGLAAYMGNLLLVPALQESQKLSDSIAQKQADLSQKNETIKQVNAVVTSLNQAKSRNQEIRGLFSSQEALDTLLLDLNRVIVQNQAEMLKFEPDYAASGIVNDGSLGPELNGKIKRQVTTVAFKGTFNQTLSIFQVIDRLQTLLVIQNLVSELQQNPDKGSISNKITSNFKLIAYVPLTPEELAAASPAPASAPPPAK